MNYYKHSANFWVQQHVYNQMNGTAKHSPVQPTPTVPRPTPPPELTPKRKRGRPCKKPSKK